LKIALTSSLEKIYNAWANPYEIEKWFLSKAEYLDANQQTVDKNKNIETGFSYEWNWYLYEPTEKGKITNANGADFIQFTFAGNCLVDIKLSNFKNYTIVELTQHQIPIDDKSKQKIRIGCHEGWTFFLANLKSIYEGGIDLRNKNPELKGMFNN
jgi:uncharacterized protein YndB with AHSA1/START domain